MCALSVCCVMFRRSAALDVYKRQDLKERGKIAFQRNYWRCVLVSFVLMLFTYGSSGSVRTTIGEDNDISYNSSHTEIYEDYEGILSGEQSGDHEGTIASWILGCLLYTS